MLQLEKVRKDFGGLRAVDSVSLTVDSGRIVGLIGPNGSGKSTLMNVISGVLPPTDGRITFEGTDITDLSADAVFEQGIVRGFQDPSLFFRMSVLDNAVLPTRHQRGERPWVAPWRWLWRNEERENARRASKALSQVRLQGHATHAASELSGGQMKLLEIARAMMGAPRLMLLDEPTAGVAPGLAYEIFEQIARLRSDEGITFLIVEHRLEMLFDFVDEVSVLHMGNVLTHGSPEEVAENEAVREVYFGD